MQLRVCFLGPVRSVKIALASVIFSKLQIGSSNLPYQGVHLDAVHLVQLLKRILDLALVCLDVADEDERVVLLDLLHGALRVERMRDDLVCIEPRRVRDRLTRVLRRARELQCLGPVEGGREPHLADLLGMYLFQPLELVVEELQLEDIRLVRWPSPLLRLSSVDYWAFRLYI